MQIVIEIPTEQYEILCKQKDRPCRLLIEKAITDGIVLPKGHGRLIDADRLLRPDMIRMCYHLENGDTAMPIIDIEHAEIVIPADKEDKDADRD